MQGSDDAACSAACLPIFFFLCLALYNFIFFNLIIYLFVCLFVDLFVCLFVCLFVYFLVYFAPTWLKTSALSLPIRQHPTTHSPQLDNSCCQPIQAVQQLSRMHPH
jgi:hypothetical protein